MPKQPILKHGNQVLDHFQNWEEFEDTLKMAQDRATTVFEADFLKNVKRRYAEFGERLYLSFNQARTLKRISEKAD